MKPSRIIIAVVLIAGLLLLYPKKEVLVPAMNVVVKSDSTTAVGELEVSRSWNHFLGSGWMASVTRPDSNGNVHFVEVSRRIPFVVKAFYTVWSPIFEHQYPGGAGSIKARDPNNHRIWQRIDFNDRNCCPTEITVLLHPPGDELDSTFTFGDLVPNE